MRARDFDVARGARFLHAFGWLAFAGLLWGGLVGSVLGGVAGAFLGALAGVVVIGGGGGALILFVTDHVGGAARVLYNPTGSGTPRRREYSFAQSLIVRGEYGKAIEAYQARVAEDPTDPDPYIAIARLLRDEMDDPEQAAVWFRRVRDRTSLDAGRSILVTRELVELYGTRLGEPLRAAPELARLAEMFPHTPDGKWAASELAELKRRMLEERT